MDWTDKYIGIPYAHKGRTRAGVDCWGLVRLVFELEFGVRLPSYLEGYASAEERAEMAALISAESQSTWMTTDEPRLGDVALLNIMGQASHVAIVVKPGLMLNVRKGSNVCLERYDSSIWHKRLLGFYRHPEIP